MHLHSTEHMFSQKTVPKIKKNITVIVCNNVPF